MGSSGTPAGLTLTPSFGAGYGVGSFYLSKKPPGRFPVSFSSGRSPIDRSYDRGCSTSVASSKSCPNGDAMDVRHNNAIYLTKRARVVLDEGNGECSTAAVATFNKNLESLGFTVSRVLFERLCAHTVEEVVLIYKEIVPVLERMVGAHRQFRPMYPNFPAQLMAASDLELYVNAMAHYWGTFVADVTGQPGYVILPGTRRTSESRSRIRSR
jgi:hypothetical protein